MRYLFTAAVAAAAIGVAGAALADPPDPTRLPVGDDRLVDDPAPGYITECRTNPDMGGAQVEGPWFNGDGTYNLLEKVSVEGEVVHAGWYFHYGVQGEERIFGTADIPDYPTGEFPVAPDDPAYQFDHNPNTISEQDFVFGIPANPVELDQPGCVPGAIGILRSGVVLFNSLDAPGRDAVAHETQDSCQGHPQSSGVYHNHDVSNCVIEEFDTTSGHSALLGYIVDGFGIYGQRGENGEILGSDDLDECHGHVHDIEWNGKTQQMFHYHATLDFPYTVGCMRGASENDDVLMISGPQLEMQMGQGRPNGRPNLEQAAADLGVSEAVLVDALGAPPPDLQGAAATLGISEAALSKALGLP
jgi:hypothetical protein